MIPPPLPPDEPRRLQALLRLGLLDTPAEERFDRIVRMAARMFGVPITLVSLLDGSRQWFKARVGLDAPSTARSLSFCGHAILSPHTFVVRDALEDLRFADNPLVTGEPHVRFYAGHPLHAPDGSPVGTLCLIDRQARDFSEEERQQLEDLASWVELELNALTIQEARTALARQERFFELSVDMLCIAGLDGTFRQLSRAWARTLGYSEPTLLATPLLELVHEEDRASTAEWLARGARGELLPYFEHRCRGQDGAWHWLQWNATVNPVEGILYGVARDVTEQKRLEAERRQVERMKSEFVSTVSHELRTPLTSIRGSLGLLEGGILGELPSQAQDMVRIARTNTERLIRLINDILDLEKIESGKLELKLQSVETDEVIEATFSGVQGMADAARVRLHADAVGAGPVRADRDRLIQVLTNLVSNAIKFSPPDSQVEVRAARDARGQVRFSVVDQGPGIPLDQRGRLFGKFQQLDSSDTRTKGGTGLGLAISQAIVEQHGGRIEVHSEPGQGATFTFSLAALRVGSGANSVVMDESRYTVLAVTKDSELSGLLRGLLTHEGYRVLRSPSLEEAEKLIEVGAPDMLVLDAQCMEGNELELVRKLREEPRTRELPVLMLSGRSSQQEGVVQPLLVDWMEKPFDEARFLLALRHAIRRPGQARVLIVDDDVSTRQVLRAQLERLGVACYEAEDGEGAVALARTTPPDLIVLDVGLPRLDGFEVVDILRQGKGRGTPLIVFTGRELSSMDQNQLTLGLTRHLTKARTSEDELLASVRDLLNGLLARRDGGEGPRKEAS